jgi:anaphase-promoting complex subunit 4
MCVEQETKNAWIDLLHREYDLSGDLADEVLTSYQRRHGVLPEPSREPGPFDVFSTTYIRTPARLLRSSCCPDKDLVVLITRPANKDRLTLYKLQGTKQWDADVDKSLPDDETIVDIYWDPTGGAICFLFYTWKLTKRRATHRGGAPSTSNQHPFISDRKGRTLVPPPRVWYGF